jgi:hypothetical protein
MAVVNSDAEAEVLRELYLNFGPGKLQPGSRDDPIDEIPDEPSDEIPDEPTDELPNPEPIDGIVHIGFHDIFIEGEYLTVRSK